jgi:hypothetical protein
MIGAALRAIRLLPFQPIPEVTPAPPGRQAVSGMLLQFVRIAKKSGKT